MVPASMIRKLLPFLLGLAAASALAQETAPIFRRDDPPPPPVETPDPENGSSSLVPTPIQPTPIAPTPINPPASPNSEMSSPPAAIFRTEPGSQGAVVRPRVLESTEPGQPGIFRTTPPGTEPENPDQEGAGEAMEEAGEPESDEPEIIYTEAPKPSSKKTLGAGFKPGLLTAKGARILTLSIPAPRGQIVDRNGVPFAQSVVAHYPSLSFPLMVDATDQEKIAYARKRLDIINAALGKTYQVDDEDILKHYETRRWLPLVVTRLPLTPVEKEKFEALGLEGIGLHPTYQRIYPQHTVAAHIIGYVGKRGPWPTGEIPDGEAMWPTAQGVRGIEKEYDDYLTGSPGTVQIIFNENGDRVEETTIANPVPGGNVVLSLDLEMQLLCEKLLAQKVKRGAFVVTEVQTGDVLAMASYPTYDPNEFIPLISSERLNELQSDPAKPLFGRAFQAAYPPASTFKTISAIGMLRAGIVTEWTEYPCPTSFTIGNRIAHNWAKTDEGSMNIIGALTRSCNTWFYQGAMYTNSAYITRAGETFGFGRATGIQLDEENTGTNPSNEWFRKRFGYAIGKGDLANIVIGQGTVEATPLQVARAMGAIGNRKSLMDARLVLQIQDYANNIITSFDVSPRPLNISQHTLAVVRQGMYDVVHHGRGTGKSAGHPRMSVSGKTGTGQWIPAKKQNIAWFSGYAPSKFPVYSFAIVYEGDPGEEGVGGSKKAAPVIGEFFKRHLTEERLVALEKSSELIAVQDAPLVGSVHLGTGTIIRGPVPEDLELQEAQNRPFGNRRAGSRSGGGGGGIFRLFRKR